MISTVLLGPSGEVKANTSVRRRTATDREAALGLAHDATLAVVQGGPCTIQPTHTDQVKGTLPVVVGVRGLSCGG
jgi:hypothetical protein